ncbi:helix-turn-helix domain-containing protein [Candidatus Falkowbacteria bacterium]|nr:helix-turn-helix domain-containing protein [Candidatus Falkowbacteria bacterium]
MVSFRSKRIANPPTLSEQLRQTRQSLEISLKEAAKATNISLRYLDALESGNSQLLPGDVYARSFLKVYAKYLGLNIFDVLDAYTAEQRLYKKINKKSDNDFKKPVERVSMAHLMVTPKIVRGAVIGLLAVACLFYLGVKFKAIATPPVLVVEQPSDNMITSQNYVQVMGRAEKETTLEINGQQILTNGDGYFSEVIDLRTGVNIIEIKAEKRHGTQNKIYRQVVVVDEEDKKEEVN